MFIEYFCNRIGVFYYSNEFIAVITIYADDTVKQTTHYAVLRMSRCNTFPAPCVARRLSRSRASKAHFLIHVIERRLR